MNDGDAQLELPFEAGIRSKAPGEVKSAAREPAVVISLSSVRLRKHAQTVLQELVSEHWSELEKA